MAEGRNPGIWMSRMKLLSSVPSVRWSPRMDGWMYWSIVLVEANGYRLRR